MLHYRIVPAALRDLRAIHGLERACFGPDAWGYLDILSALVFSGVRLKAVADGKVVGFVVGEPRLGQDVAWIATIGVHPHYQGRGLGVALLAACEGSLGASRLKLTVRISNQVAISLYRRFGYRRVGLWQGYYAGGEDGIVMEKVRASS